MISSFNQISKIIRNFWANIKLMLVMTLRLIFLLAFLFFTSSCKLVLVRGFLGFDTTPEYMEDSALEKRIKKRKIPLEQAYYFKDDSFYKEIKEHYYAEKLLISESSYLNEEEKEEKLNIISNKMKDDSQFVKLMIFKDNETVYKSLNCFINPLSFLNPFKRAWNIENSLDDFPPKPLSAITYPLNESNDLEFYINNSESLNDNQLQVKDLPEAKYYMVIVWNDIAIKYSRKLIKHARRYVKKHKEHDIHIIYINNHNAFIWNQLEDSDKEKILETKLNAKKE